MQAYGLIRGSDAHVVSGSGNFSIEKTGTGAFAITLQGCSSQPVVVATPFNSPYNSAVVQPGIPGSGTDPETNQNPSIFAIQTGYTNQEGLADISHFTFVAYYD
jgi:hypothetical protein